jgi:hypothetical protein
MRTSESTIEISKALAAAQAAVTPPKRNKTANTGTYSYSYADLDGIVEAVREHLTTNGLSVAQDVTSEGGMCGVSTRLLHTSGEWIETGPLYLPAGNTPQSFGSAITYARRYSLTSILNITTDDDDDARAASSEAGGAPASSGPTAIATAKQVNMIAAKAKEREVAELVVNALITKKWGAEHPRKLTKMQASEFIDWLTKSDDDTLDAAVAKVQGTQEATA